MKKKKKKQKLEKEKIVSLSLAAALLRVFGMRENLVQSKRKKCHGFCGPFQECEKCVSSADLKGDNLWYWVRKQHSYSTRKEFKNRFSTRVSFSHPLLLSACIQFRLDFGRRGKEVQIWRSETTKVIYSLHFHSKNEKKRAHTHLNSQWLKFYAKTRARD